MQCLSIDTFPQLSKNIRQKETENKIEHLTVKPVILIEHLIRLFTQEGQTVLDTFMGSGSHGVAAINTNRNFIGFEIEPKYFEICEKRLKKVSENNQNPIKNEEKELTLFD